MTKINQEDYSWRDATDKEYRDWLGARRVTSINGVSYYEVAKDPLPSVVGTTVTPLESHYSPYVRTVDGWVLVNIYGGSQPILERSEREVQNFVDQGWTVTVPGE